MATEQSTTPTVTEGESTAKWTGWIAALLGLWVLVSSFVLSGEIASGTPMYSNVIAGIIIAVLAGFTAYTYRSNDERAGEPAEWTGWLAALLGLWVLVSPFVLSGSVGSGTPFWSNVVAGILIAVFGAYAGYEF